jgi:hypothetical protein
MVLRPDESVEALVAAGNRSCPACGGSLRPWGRARWRVVRDLGGQWGHRPARVRCTACRVTQVVLPPDVLVRRRDAVAVVGRAWCRAADGQGVRRIAVALGVPMETVRGWVRRLRALVAVTRPAASTAARLRMGLAALEADAAAAGWQGEGDVWRFAAHRSQGRLLRNTS